MTTLKRYFPFLFALIFATLASFSMYQFLRDRGNVSQAALSTETIPVVVAKGPIAFGKKLTEEDLKTVPWPENSVPEQSFQSIDPLIGRVTRTYLVENEPVLSTKLISEGENFSSLIPPHMRGVTVTVGRSQALADILVRGTTVDVIAMYDNQVGPPTTKVIAQNVSVLAVHKGSPDIDPEREPKNMEVTLLVTPREAEWLVTATNKGVIQLAVRNSKEEATISVNTQGSLE